MDKLLNDAYAVLLPAFASLELNESVLRYLDNGGVSLLFGESREEYVARSMTVARRSSETAEAFRTAVDEARQRTRAPLLIAVDQELGGIERLHDLVPSMPSAAPAVDVRSSEIAACSYTMARAARSLGVNLFLAPIVDVVTGENPWLKGRHLGSDECEVSRIACAFVRGAQEAGVAATAKHFPGHPVTKLDPALHEAVVEGSMQDLQPTLNVFRDLIEGGVKAIMAGPTLVPALDPVQPSSTSRRTLAFLREELRFQGLIISDDLDAPGILRGRPIAEVAVASIAAGADLLLLSSEAGLDDIAQAIVSAVHKGMIEVGRLSDAANRVRALAIELDAERYTTADVNTKEGRCA